MHINSVDIKKYQVLEDLHIEFQIPKDGENIVNIIAGVNGSGKTTLLRWMLKGLNRLNSDIGGTLVRDEIEVKGYKEGYRYNEQLHIDNIYTDGIHSSPRVIFIPSNMKYDYKAQTKLNTEYKFENEIDPNSLLGNAEFFIKEYIITEERLSNKSDPKERTKDAIDSFNAIFAESDLITKLVNLDVHDSNKPIFETLNGDTITIDKLSSGEQQLYARVVALMILNPHNSIVLIDEPEIALHPKWQIEIMKIYANIGKGNQFIVATHSPFIISQTPYKNLTFLVKENEKIVAKQFTEPPLDRDINTIVKTIMGAEYMPRELKLLRQKYRELFNQELENTSEAKELEKKILNWESPNSSFWQGIAFDKELRSI